MCCVLEGGQWLPHIATLALCPRCMAAPDTLIHRYWECEDNDSLDIPEVKKTQRWREAASQDTEHKCFWTRGQLPRAWTHAPPDDDDDHSDYDPDLDDDASYASSDDSDYDPDSSDEDSTDLPLGPTPTELAGVNEPDSTT